MFRQFVVAALVVVALVGAERAVRANGRPPATVSITFRQGHETDIVAGLTFGPVLSHDGGATWQWMCENVLGNIPASEVPPPYDPRYAYTGSGALFATTLRGFEVMRDGCAFQPAQIGSTFVSTAALGPDGTLYVGAAQTVDATHSTADFQIYKSVDDDKTPPTGSRAAADSDVNVWWSSILPTSDPKIVYLTGYRYVMKQPDAGVVREHLLFRSDDAGATWKPLSTRGLSLMANSEVFVAGVRKDDARHVYVRVEFSDNAVTDTMYVSANGGDTDWSEIEHKTDRIHAFVVRGPEHQHDLVLGTTKLGAEISHDDGKTWTALDNAPHMGCLVENSAGELWACTQNYGVMPAPTDGAGIMKTSDLKTWTKVLRYEDLTEAVSCAAGTTQHDTCAGQWCIVCQQLGCTPSSSYKCPVTADTPVTPPPASKGGGCCDAGAGAGGTLALALSVATVLRRPRRRRGPR